MLNLTRCFVLLVALLASGGSPRVSRSHKSDAGPRIDPTVQSTPDAGTPDLPAAHADTDAGSMGHSAASVEPEPELDAGMPAYPPLLGQDAGSPTFTDSTGKVIPWPETVHPMAVLDGPAVVAANAALQHVLARFPKEYAKDCLFSAKGLEVVVSKQGEVYFIHINQRVDQCGIKAFGPSIWPDWFEFYAVSADGRVLARFQ